MHVRTFGMHASSMLMQHVYTQLLLKMCDSLNRYPSVTARPDARLALPQAAYRLLLEFLKCERSFCHYIVPTFLPFGWILLRVVRHDLPMRRKEDLCVASGGAMGAEHRRERARRAVRLAMAEEAARRRSD